jgi:nitroimidazol reductase NimA-like FMN-containing flavoprotein (pyridoxamine 5'-phosphate oxidase superfamily)
MTESAHHSDQPINRVRRRDRAVEDDTWIGGFFRQAPYGVLATEAGGQPFTTPLLFVYDEQTSSLYFHTARTGRINTNLAANPRVSFCASRMGRLLHATAAAGFDVEYDSTVAFGQAALVEGEEAERALRLLIEKYFPGLHYGQDYRPITPEQLARTAVYQIKIEAWSGKRNAADPEAGPQ